MDKRNLCICLSFVSPEPALHASDKLLSQQAQWELWAGWNSGQRQQAVGQLVHRVPAQQRLRCDQVLGRRFCTLVLHRNMHGPICPFCVFHFWLFNLQFKSIFLHINITWFVMHVHIHVSVLYVLFSYFYFPLNHLISMCSLLPKRLRCTYFPFPSLGEILACYVEVASLGVCNLYSRSNPHLPSLFSPPLRLFSYKPRAVRGS